MATVRRMGMGRGRRPISDMNLDTVSPVATEAPIIDSVVSRTQLSTEPLNEDNKKPILQITKHYGTANNTETDNHSSAVREIKAFSTLPKDSSSLCEVLSNEKNTKEESSSDRRCETIRKKPAVPQRVVLSDCIKKRRQPAIGVWREYRVSHHDLKDKCFVWLSDLDSRTETIEKAIALAERVPLTQLSAGGAAVAEIDGQYKRVILENIRSTGVDIVDVDSGKPATVDLSKLFTMSKSLRLIEPLAFRAVLEPAAVGDGAQLRNSLEQVVSTSTPVSTCIFSWSTTPKCLLRLPGCKPLRVDPESVPILDPGEKQQIEKVVQQLYGNLPPVTVPSSGFTIIDAVVTHVDGLYIYATWDALQNASSPTDTIDEPLNFTVGNLCCATVEEFGSIRCCIEKVNTLNKLAIVRWVDSGKTFQVSFDCLSPLAGKDKCQARTLRCLLKQRPIGLKTLPERAINCLLYSTGLKLIILNSTPEVLIYTEDSIEFRAENFEEIWLKVKENKTKFHKIRNCQRVQFQTQTIDPQGAGTERVHPEQEELDSSEYVLEEGEIVDEEDVKQGSDVKLMDSNVTNSEKSGEQLRDNVNEFSCHSANGVNSVGLSADQGDSGSVPAYMEKLDSEKQLPLVRASTDHPVHQNGSSCFEEPESLTPTPSMNTTEPFKKVIVTCVSSVSNIWVVPAEQLEDLQRLEKTLSRENLEQIPVSQVKLGMLCVVRLSSGSYRARVGFNMGNRFIVNLLDYSKAACVQEVFKVPSSIEAVPSFGFRVSLCEQQQSNICFTKLLRELTAHPEVLIWDAVDSANTDRVFVTTHEAEDFTHVYDVGKNENY